MTSRAESLEASRIGARGTVTYSFSVNCSLAPSASEGFPSTSTSTSAPVSHASVGNTGDLPLLLFPVINSQLLQQLPVVNIDIFLNP
jgi:hypothetical protein